ncbi:MAG: chemotaxis protein CheW, partial [Arcobacteraceae bacterium]
YNEHTAVIAVITDDKRMIGIVVDKVDDVQKLDISHLAPVSDMGSAIPSKYLKGYVRLENNEMLVIMDVESVVSKEELQDS